MDFILAANRLWATITPPAPLGGFLKTTIFVIPIYIATVLSLFASDSWVTKAVGALLKMIAQNP